MTKRGLKYVARNQFSRACSLRRYLERACMANALPGHLSDSASYAIANWLAREYKLGVAAGKREK